MKPIIINEKLHIWIIKYTLHCAFEVAPCKEMIKIQQNYNK